MDVSTTNLVPYEKQSKYAYPPAYVSTHSDRHRRKVRQQNGSLWFAFILMFISFIAMSCIGAYYISHLQNHVLRIETQMQMMMKESNCKPCKTDSEGSDVRPRVKRDTKRNHTAPNDALVAEESEHIRREHHGISRHNIAMVFGDPDNIPTEPDPSDSELQFKNSDRKSMRCHHGLELMKNGKGHYWCKRTGDVKGRTEYMQFTWYNHDYYYFKRASWMRNASSVSNYNLTNDGRIVVRQSGIYIVHASIYFTDVDKRDTPHYGVYKTDGLRNNKQLVSKCVVSPSHKEVDDGSGVFPCQAWQLTHLNSGDQVYLKIGGYTWFQVEKETFHLALIRLNNDSL